MSESEETKWRLSTASEQRDTASSSSEEQEKKEELQERVQSKAEDIDGGGEGSLVTKTDVPIIEARKQQRKTRKKSLKSSDASRKKEPINNLATISKLLKKQANQLARIEKISQQLQKSFNKMDKQSNTIKQLYTIVTQLQRQLSHRQLQQQRSRKNRVKI
jgi:hypothetical protein